MSTRPTRSSILFFLRSAAALAGVAAVLVACASSSDEDTSDSSDEIIGSCANSAPDGAGGVWLNFPANQIGCGNDVAENPLVRLPAFYDGSLMQGRIRCGYEWLRSNDPATFQALGQVTTNETHYFSPDGFDAWYNQFSTGSKVQFEWRGPCGDQGNGYVKFYVVPCNFTAADISGGVYYESQSCGTRVRQTKSPGGGMRVEAWINGAHGIVDSDGDGRFTVVDGDERTVQIAENEVGRAIQLGRVRPASPSVDWACVASGANALASSGVTIAACVIPEPLEPVACAASIGTTLTATAQFAVVCH